MKTAKTRTDPATGIRYLTAKGFEWLAAETQECSECGREYKQYSQERLMRDRRCDVCASQAWLADGLRQCTDAQIMEQVSRIDTIPERNRAALLSEAAKRSL